MRILVISCVVFFLLAIINGNVDAFKSYFNYQLWRLYPTNSEQVEKLREFSRIAHEHDVNFWTERFLVNVPVSFFDEYHFRYSSLSL